MASPPDREAYVDALDDAIALSTSVPAKIHGTWLAAEALRDAGKDEAVAQRLEYAARLCSVDAGRPSDVRPIVALAVRALARGESASPALRLPHTGDVAPIAAAAEACLRLRGADRGDSSDGSPASEALLRLRQALQHGDTAKAAVLLSRLALVPELFGPATWLGAAFAATRTTTRRDAANALGELSRRGDGDASDALMARAIELGDGELLVEAMAGRTAMTSAERIVVTLLGAIPFAAGDSQLEAAAGSPGMGPLAAAAAAVAPAAAGRAPLRA
ncbi:MAG: hypothetical protein M3O36_12765, partial [Myxococcota bacterium]|nr:hypothetical protein [Myxococcota bacterium]